MYEKKLADGFEVLEIPKGSWIEAIFAKEKPEEEKPTTMQDDELQEKNIDSEENEDEDLPEIEDNYNDDDDDDDFDEDKLTEESYRTTFDDDPENLGLEAEDVADDYEE